jgi:hypothetical protein
MIKLVKHMKNLIHIHIREQDFKKGLNYGTETY